MKPIKLLALILFPTLVLALNLAGCAAHRLQPGETPASIKVNTLIERAAHGRAHLEFRKHGRVLQNRKITLTPDSLSILTWRGQVDTIVPLRELRSITFVSHAKGLAVGLGAGLMGGAVLGITLGLISGDEEDTYSSGFGGPERVNPGLKAESKAAMGGVLLGALGGMVGAIAGGIGGVPEIFLLPEPAAVDSAAQ